MCFVGLPSAIYEKRIKTKQTKLVCVLLKIVTWVQRPLLDLALDLLPCRQPLTTNLTGYPCKIDSVRIYFG